MDFAGLSVLVVSGQRAHRRTLFDAFDAMGVGAIYSARSAEQAREFIDQTDIALMVLELGFDRITTRGLIEHLSSRAPSAGVLAVFPAGEVENGFGWDALPDGVSECIGSPVVPGELAFRCTRMLSESSRSEDGDEDLIFEGVELPLIISDAKFGEILAVNQTFADWTSTEPADWKGRPIEDLGLKEDAARSKAHWRILRSDGRVRFRCPIQLPKRGEVTVELVRRLGMYGGRMAYLTRLSDVSREIHVAKGLDLASALSAPEADERTSAGLLDGICGWLGVDFFHVWARDGEGQLIPVAAHNSAERPLTMVPLRDHLPFRKLRQGEEVVATKDAARAVGRDPFVRDNALECYIGLPLMAADGRVIGALVAAGATALAQPEAALSTLRLIAAHFASRWEIRDLRAQSEIRGLHDPLTGLPNRMLFNDRLAIALKEAQRAGETFAVMFVDLDRFKTINDTLGHNIGDQVLRGVAQRLQRAVRASDTVARYAGDEFTVVLRHVVQKEDVMRVAQKVNTELSSPLQIEGSDELLITASIGVSFFPDDGRSRDQLLKRADQAMYSAKSMGRNTCQSYVARDEESQQQKLQLEAKLRVAEANKELRVYYQPQVRSSDEDIIGMEALIRWEHPELGLISPGFFIPLAEETGLIVSIGEWLLRRAVKDTKAWHQRFELPLTLGVNLSPLQLKQPDLPQIVESALNEASLEPRYLDLEVTESISIKTISGLREKLEALRDLGCKVSIDDFGTGQSSLDYLKRFPADRIKIDQSFVRNISIDPDDAAIVRATISMAHNLNMGVIAEGVEDEEHLDFLRQNGCDELQGYLFCRPIPADSFSRMLLEREQLMT